ncbi:transposase-like protein [Sphingomonas jinjuensis]|uniref:Transposase-like protein n=1 Tax=Sphingomonas jinjuensis TaxID=535907 RepID=A0A840FIU3_9SPHN|nr:helix-turn-helix domain-containing protein [Sphingomonas jinjuensis]MBB4155614.1 transposase-like protein [Sphingomonas jinjuensis]
MARPLSPRQLAENEAFLAALARCGNVREAARALGVHRSTLTKRRAKHPAFATAWAAALVVSAATPDDGEVEGLHRVRTAGGSQWRRNRPGGITRAAEQAFLLALSATANVRLAAAAAGFSHASFYARRRRDPVFAREMRLALETGYDRIELALLAQGLDGSGAAEAWRHNDPPPIPPMTANQALQLLYLHQKEARLLAEPAHLKRKRGESKDAHHYRIAVMYRLAQARERERFELAEAGRRARGEASWAPERVALPDLAQVGGWSKAKPGGEAGQDRALFGGKRKRVRAGRRRIAVRTLS